MSDTPPATEQACQALNAQGKPCRAGVRAGKRFCFQHDPERRHEATAARVAGGKARSKPAPADPIDLSTPELQRKAIEETIDRVRRGDEPLNVARFVVYAVSVVRGTFDDELVKRLEALETRYGKS
jgi:hypothetical protein